MRILNWNVWGAIGIGAARTERIISLLRNINADVLLLQEVPLRGDFLERLRGEGYQVTDPRSARPGLWKKGNAAVAASRLPMQEIDRPDGLRFEQLFTPVRIGGIELASCHIPNASGHNSIARELGLPRDIKVAHLESAVSWLRAKSNRLIVGDFNEPDYIDSKSGNAISFPSSDSAHQDRQDSAINALFNSDTPRHLCAHLHAAPEPPTHSVNGRAVWFDHALFNGASDDWTASYLHNVRSDKGSGKSFTYSDHSAMLIEKR